MYNWFFITVKNEQKHHLKFFTFLIFSGYFSKLFSKRIPKIDGFFTWLQFHFQSAVANMKVMYIIRMDWWETFDGIVLMWWFTKSLNLTKAKLMWETIENVLKWKLDDSTDQGSPIFSEIGKQCSYVFNRLKANYRLFIGFIGYNCAV